MNLCRTCGQDFSSVRAFDKHRVGRHQPLERRCMSIEEMRAAGMDQDSRGRWRDTANALRGLQGFAESDT